MSIKIALNRNEAVSTHITKLYYHEHTHTNTIDFRFLSRFNRLLLLVEIHMAAWCKIRNACDMIHLVLSLTAYWFFLFALSLRSSSYYLLLLLLLFCYVMLAFPASHFFYYRRRSSTIYKAILERFVIIISMEHQFCDPYIERKLSVFRYKCWCWRYFNSCTDMFRIEHTANTTLTVTYTGAHTHTHTYFHIIASFVLQNRETESVSWELCAGKINPVRNFNFLSRWMGCKFSSHSSNLIICQNENWRNRRNGTLTWHRTFSSPLSTNMIWGKLFRFSSSFLVSFLGHAESWRRLLCSLFEGIFLQRKLFLWPAMAELCVCVAIKCEWDHSPPIINTPPSQQLRVSFDEHIASNYKQESTKVFFCHHYVPHRYL